MEKIKLHMWIGGVVEYEQVHAVYQDDVFLVIENLTADGHPVQNFYDLSTIRDIEYDHEKIKKFERRKPRL